MIAAVEPTAPGEVRVPCSCAADDASAIARDDRRVPRALLEEWFINLRDQGDTLLAMHDDLDDLLTEIDCAFGGAEGDPRQAKFFRITVAALHNFRGMKVLLAEMKNEVAAAIDGAAHVALADARGDS